MASVLEVVGHLLHHLMLQEAVVHDILYEKINTQYKVVNESVQQKDEAATKRKRIIS